jgi:hypothetical protein
MQALGGVISHPLEANATGAGATVLDFDRADDEHFAVMATTAPPMSRSFLLRQTIT